MVYEDILNLGYHEIWVDWEEGGIHKGIFGVYGVVLRFCSSVFRLI